jgi:hypothetical protein
MQPPLNVAFILLSLVIGVDVIVVAGVDVIVVVSVIVKVVKVVTAVRHMYIRIVALENVVVMAHVRSPVDGGVSVA